MAEDEGPLVGVAAAILDGTPVDWEAVHASANPADVELLRHLKVLSTVADLQRSVSSLPIPVEWGHLRLLERIGDGAFGEVFRAWDTRLDREVALKLLPPGPASTDARASSIIEEGRLLARVRHPNVVTIYGAERIGDRVGLWMELVEGRTLEQAIGDGRQFSPREVIDIGIEVAQAIGAAHAAGLLHRDIKAQNVMLTAAGRVVLMDFGTGLEVGASRDASLAGTPRYLAPELFAGGSATEASDLYSLGVLLFRMAAGAYPVKAGDVQGLREAHARGERARLRDVRPDVQARVARVIDRLLDPDPARRGGGADALALELSTIRRGRFRGPWAKAAMAAAGLAVITGLAWATRSDPPVIAVLPFEVSGSEADGKLVGDGLTEEIFHHLARIDGLRIFRASPSAIEGRPASAGDAGAALGANMLLKGSMARSGRLVRADVQLIRAGDAAAIWTDAWDADFGDVFAIQDRVARGVANRLGLTIRRQSPGAVADPAAQQAYLTARGLVEKRGIENARRAAALFEEVIRLDRSNARAWAGRANAYGQLSMTYDGMPLDEALPILRESALRAIDLDPLLAEAHAAMGLLHTRDFNWDASVAAYRRALELDPALTLAATSFVLWTLTPLERFNEAERVLADARTNAPLSLDVQRELGNVRLLTGRYAEAVTLFQTVLAVEPRLPFVRLYSALTWAGRPDEAIALMREDAPGGHGYLAHAYVKAGRRADAERLLEPTRPFPMRHAMVQTALGDADGAFEALERMLAREGHRVPRLLVYPEMAMLRGLPKYADLRRRLNLPDPGPGARR